MKSFGPTGPKSNPLLVPNDQLLDALTPLLNMSRGRTLGIYLTGRYACSPADVLADSLVPSLKGSDATLYHALKLYRLTPELRWTAANHIWPVDKTVKFKPYTDRISSSVHRNINYVYSKPTVPVKNGRHGRRRMSGSVVSYEAAPSSSGSSSSGRGGYSRASRSVFSDSDEEFEADVDDVVAANGAAPLQEKDIVMLATSDENVFRGDVSVASKGKLTRVEVNLLLLFYVD